jgi:hypothetical protein
MSCHIAGPLQGQDDAGNDLGCAFYTGTTAMDIWNRFESIVIGLDPQVAAEKKWANQSDIATALSTLKNQGLHNLYSTRSFPTLANLLLEIESAIAAGNISAMVAANAANAGAAAKMMPSGNLIVADGDGDAMAAVLCSDASPGLRNATAEQVLPFARFLDSQQWLYTGDDAYQCVGWQIDPIGDHFMGA